MPKSPSSVVYSDNFSKEGLVTDRDPDKLPEGSLARAENIRYIPGGGFVMRRGSQAITSFVPGTAKPINSLEVMREFQVLFFQSGTKIFQALSDTAPCYDTGIALTLNNRIQMQEYNSSMYYVNAVDPFGQIACATVLTQFTNASTAISLNLGHGDQFPVEGYTPAFLTCKNDATAIVATWNAVHDGAFNITLDNRAATDITGCDFASCVTMADVAAVIQKQLRAQLLNTSATVVWSTDHFVITSGFIYNYATTTGLSALAVLAAPGAGTDLSGAGGTRFMSGNTGNGVVTNAVLSTVPVYCKGQLITYTRRIGDTFTGVTIPSGTYEVGAVITCATLPEGAPNGNVIATLYEKMYVAGNLTAPNVEFYSKTANITSLSAVSDFGNGGRELFGKVGKITAMKPLLTYLYVWKDERGIEAWTSIGSNGVPVRQPFNEVFGCMNADCVKNIGDRLIFFSNNRRFKSIQPATAGFNPLPVIDPYFDQKIKGTLMGLDKTQNNARMGYNLMDELMRATVFQSNVRQTIIYDTIVNCFAIDKGYAPDGWVEWNGSMYFGSAFIDTIYKAETGAQDDQVSYAMDVLSPVHYVGNRRELLDISHIYLTGLILPQTQLVVTVYVDGFQVRQATIYGNNANYVQTSQARPFGLNYFGQDSFGFGGGDDTDAGFAYSVGIEVDQGAHNIQIRFQCAAGRVQVDSYDVIRTVDQNTSDETQGVII